MAEAPLPFMQRFKENKIFKMAFAVTGIMSTLLIYGVLQALKYVSFPVQTLAKCAKMIPVMDKLFKGYDMDIHNQIFYTTLCSCMLSFTGLILQGTLPMALVFVSRHTDCFIDIAILSTVATSSQFFITYTIRNFGALASATIMTTRQLVSILLSCVWFSHPLSSEQLIGAVIVFGSIYSKSLLRSSKQSSSSSSSSTEQTENRASSPPRANT